MTKITIILIFVNKRVIYYKIITSNFCEKFLFNEDKREGVNVKLNF